MKTRIATSPLSGRILAGHVNTAGTAFVGETKDVTSDVLGAFIEKARFHGGSFPIEGSNGASYTVTVTENAAIAQTTGAKP